ncbi:hypothetical protein, partial [Cronobacter sakazakii]|uniref:hypothetical protein n=1 Tax=Cronobacter sakazakii TaxID=28141 RepID=UPI001F3C6206
DLKELPSADLHGLLLVQTLSQSKSYGFSFADAAATVHNRNSLLNEEGLGATEYHNVAEAVSDG